MSYSDFFGSNPVYVARPSYLAVAVNPTFQLTWPNGPADSATNIPTYFKATSVGGDGILYLPPGIGGSDGASFLVANASGSALLVRRYGDVSDLIAVAPGQSFIIILTDNSTTLGQWDYIASGTVVSIYDAAGLAGVGLTSMAGRLLPSSSFINFNVSRAVQSTDREQLLNWNGGSGTFTLADMSSFGPGFQVVVKNSGSGALTLDRGTGTINGLSANYILNPGDSTLLTSVGEDWVTSLDYFEDPPVFTAGNIAISPTTGTMALNSGQTSTEIQNFTGTKTGNLAVDYGGTVGVWFVTNSTLGSYDMTYKATSLDPGVIIPAGNTAVISSDGTTMRFTTPTSGSVTSIVTGTGLTGGPISTTGTISLANTAVSPGTYGNTGSDGTVPNITVDAQGRITNAVNYDGDLRWAQLIGATFTGTVAFPVGSAAAPSITFAGDLNTGIYRPTSDCVAVVTGGVERFRVFTGGGVYIGTTVTDPNPGIHLSPGGSANWGFNNTTSGSVYHSFHRNTTIIGSITQNGTTGVNFNTTSDYRLKDPIRPADHATAVKNLRSVLVREYMWKASPERGAQIGFFAHELAKYIPDAVSGEKDAVDENGNIKPQVVDHSRLVPSLVLSIQEAFARIEALEAKLSELGAE